MYYYNFGLGLDILHVHLFNMLEMVSTKKKMLEIENLPLNLV